MIYQNAAINIAAAQLRLLSVVDDQVAVRWRNADRKRMRALLQCHRPVSTCFSSPQDRLVREVLHRWMAAVSATAPLMRLSTRHVRSSVTRRSGVLLAIGIAHQKWPHLCHTHHLVSHTGLGRCQCAYQQQTVRIRRSTTVTTGKQDRAHPWRRMRLSALALLLRVLCHPIAM